ncbi:unnamed protein product [Cylicocyclus nassatus]|uniref:Uncharacterized protein n=1 Tax=Cylicocyclus nassatus TaxID=53992 RepID=A0AA36GHG2_CYLNA|nr:unnamed protein product [Cylicocyclus nassatus]
MCTRFGFSSLRNCEIFTAMKQLPVIFLFMLLCQRNCESGTVDRFAEYNEINATTNYSVLDDKRAENKVLEDALRNFNLSAYSNLAATGNKSNSHPITLELHYDDERKSKFFKHRQKSRKFGDDLKRTGRRAPSQITTNHCKLKLFYEKCVPAGEEISPGKLSMCYTCKRIYHVSYNCYPRVLTAEFCDRSNGDCAFDNGRRKGTCISTYSTVTLLGGVGNDNCTNFLPENFEMPTGCQCALRKHSALKATWYSPSIQRQTLSDKR